MCCVIHARQSLEMQKKRGFGVKDGLTEASLGWKCFGNYNKNREFYAFNDKYVRDFIRKPIKGGRVAALNRYFEPKKCEETLNTFEKHLKINENEVSIILHEYLKYIYTKRGELMLEFENREKDHQKKGIR